MKTIKRRGIEKRLGQRGDALLGVMVRGGGFCEGASQVKVGLGKERFQGWDSTLKTVSALLE